jgi:hypothetical protein
MTELKTLKDDNISVEIRKAKFEHDMDLKTLKDIGFFTEVRNVPNIFKKSKEEAVFKFELKQEAIKWVKHMRSLCNDKYTMANDFIKFFNLTKEDLK